MHFILFILFQFVFSFATVQFAEINSIGNSGNQPAYIRILDGRTFWVFPHIKVNWNKAFEYCDKILNAELISIRSERDQNDLNDLLLDLRLVNNRYWTSGNANGKSQTSKWQWGKSNESINYTNWYPGEPNNLDGKEDCIEIISTTNATGLHNYWNDYPCRRHNSYICAEKHRSSKNKFLKKVVVSQSQLLAKPKAEYIPEQPQCAETSSNHIQRELEDHRNVNMLDFEPGTAKEEQQFCVKSYRTSERSANSD